METNKIVGAIVIAGLIIAGAIYFKDRPFSGFSANRKVEKNPLANFRPVDAQIDHIRGQIDAPVFIVEYSDLECPFCKTFHQTLKRLVDEYGGQKNQLAWVYRHFPLESTHTQARKEAEAAECVAELGGNEKFWQYIDKIFETTPSNDGLDLTLLPKLAEDLQIDRQQFKECFNGGKKSERVSNDLANAIEIGAEGAPYTVIFNNRGDVVPIFGAPPYDELKQLIDEMLKRASGTNS